MGRRRELFIDDHLIDRLDGVALTMAQPRDEGPILRCDRPWEGRYTGYGTVMQIAPAEYRFYYSGCPAYTSDQVLDRQACVLFSVDGIHWERPCLGLFEAHGTRDNNVILAEPEFALNFAPFEDREGTPATERFKAVAGTRFTGLVLFASEDGIHWRKLFGGESVVRGDYLDSLNRVFWSEAEQCYVLYARVWLGGWEGHRWIGRATSDDLEHWTPLEAMRILHGGEDVPLEHYYHNGAFPYFRAPHITIGLCSQMTERRVLRDDQIAGLDLESAERADACGSGGLITSRGGLTFQRAFLDDFVRPLPGPENWVARCNYPSAGIVQTGPKEMSFYVHCCSGQPGASVRRYSLRLDGFASLRANYSGGEAVTRPFTFEGELLHMNYATSARGSIELQFETPDGSALDGFTFVSCPQIVGDEIEGQVRFPHPEGLTSLAGRPVRLRVEMRDADLYALQFGGGEAILGTPPGSGRGSASLACRP